MNVLTIALGALVVLLGAYFVHGRRLERDFGIDPNRPTPAHTKADGIDHVAAYHWTVLFGHHFSSIAGAGPIVGPVIAVALWGWAPALLWVVIGTIFLGGVHDFGALIVSVRHGGRSIADVAENLISRKAKIVFSLFVWLALILVIAVFVVLCAKTFVVQPQIIIPSLGLIPVAILVGIGLYKLKINQTITTIFGLASLVGLIFLGNRIPINVGNQAMLIWSSVLLVYCYFASITPVNILLQPRDYLSSFLLFAGLILGYVGFIVSHPRINLPSFVAWKSSEGELWPMLFVTVACGAISGFHALIASGTTSKQIASEKEIRQIGYGAMIAEGLVAVMAILVVVTGFSSREALVKVMGNSGVGPVGAFGQGYGEVTRAFLGGYGSSFAMLVLNAFILTTLDTATRIGRYLSEELFRIKNRHFSTILVVVLSAALALSGKWNKIWPIFGASNQLVAALALVVITSWMLAQKKKYRFIAVPAIFMLVTTMGALFLQLVQFLKEKNFLLMSIDLALVVLALFMVSEAKGILFRKKNNSN